TGGGAVTPIQGGGGSTAAVPSGAAPTGAAGNSKASGPNTASDRGVTPTEIEIGNIVTTGGPFGPDQFSVSRYGAQAYFQALNARGGINGRKVNFLPCPDSSGTTDGASSCVHQLIDQSKVFAFVGNNIFQYGGADYVNSQDVPDIGGQPIDKVYYQYPHLYTILGSGTARDGTHLGTDGQNYYTDEAGLFFKQKYGVTKVGVVYYDQASSKYGADQASKGFETAGLQVKEYSVNLGLPNFASTVAQMQNDGVDMVNDALDVNGNQKLCQAMEANGSFISKVKVKLSTISIWTQQVGSQFSGTPKCQAIMFSSGKSANFDDPNANAQVAAFQAAMTKYYPSLRPKEAQWMLEGWAAADWFTSAAQSCGANLTRVCVEHWLNTQTSLSAHGLLDPSISFIKRTPAQQQGTSRQCIGAVQWDVTKNVWATRADPNKDCYTAQGYGYAL
ncbi:MAG TPA: ABC transporter substrate-binding protein, partial [Mycobacteriales bacterium]|nr:ABC transporter substrate-binding protein [Mycobacteriales bacterium]